LVSEPRPSAALWITVVVAAFVCALLIVRAMKSTPPPRAGLDAGDPTTLTASDPPLHALGSELLGASRCSEAAKAVPIDESAPSEAIAIGDGLLDARGRVAVGILHPTDGGRMAALATFALNPPNARATILDVGPGNGDDPPPKPFALADAIAIARMETTRDHRRLVIALVGSLESSGDLRGGTKELAAIPQTADESLAFDVAADDRAAFVVWDDDDQGRGVVRAVRIDPATKTVSLPFVVSPKTSDAEAPRVTLDGAGNAFIAWIARKVDPAEAEGGAPASVVERGAEAPETRWVEVAHIAAAAAGSGGDASLAAATESVRLAASRVSEFDLQTTHEGAGLLMRDEEGTLEARGAKLVRQGVRLSGARLSIDPPVVVARDGVGSVEPILVDDGVGGAAFFGDIAERTRLVPLAGGAPSTPSPQIDAGPSVEPLLEGARVLAARSAAGIPGLHKVPPPSARAALVIAAGSRGGHVEARILLCER
jgi:hypothetical protein